MTKTTHLKCSCGQTQLEVVGEPIISVACCCNSCREAGGRLQNLPNALPIIGVYGETPFVLYRKDRIRFLKGAEHFRESRLQPKAQTRRVIAACCNTPVFLEFQGGHWLSLYGGLWPAATRPPPVLRTMTSDLQDASVLPNDVPNRKQQSLSFFAKLFGAWVAMGFRRPKIATNGELQA